MKRLQTVQHGDTSARIREALQLLMAGYVSVHRQKCTPFDVTLNLRRRHLGCPTHRGATPLKLAPGRQLFHSEMTPTSLTFRILLLSQLRPIWLPIQVQTTPVSFVSPQLSTRGWNHADTRNTADHVSSSGSGASISRNALIARSLSVRLWTFLRNLWSETPQRARRKVTTPMLGRRKPKLT